MAIDNYIEKFHHLYPEEKLTDELKQLFQWVAPPGGKKITVSFHAMVGFHDKIHPWIEQTKALQADVSMDLLTMNIYRSLARYNLGMSIEAVLSATQRVRENYTHYDSQDKTGRANILMLNIFCYLALHHPDLSKEVAKIKAEHVFKTIEPYLFDARGSVVYLSKVGVKRIEAYLWIEEYHPHVRQQFHIRECLNWARNIAMNDTYERTSLSFPPSYPFCSIAFVTKVNGTAELTISSKLFLSLPILKVFLVLPGAYQAPNDIMLLFDLRKQSESDIEKIVKTFLAMIEQHLLPENTQQGAFTEAKDELLAATYQFFKDSANNFPGLKYAQRFPLKESKESNTATGLDIDDAIRSLNSEALRVALQAGADPNQRVWQSKPLSTAVRLTDATLSVGERQQQADKILQLIALLLEYGAKLTRNFSNSQTALEQFISYAYINKLDDIDKNLIIRGIKLMLGFDKESYLVIDQSYKDHFLGKIILAGLGCLKQGKMPTPKILATALRLKNSRQTLEIVSKQQSLFLEIMPLSWLLYTESDREDIINLCLKAFPWKKNKNINKQKFIEYISKKLRPSENFLSLIDVLRDATGKIVAFNIADIVMPHSKNDSVIYYIRLSASEPFVGKQFGKMATILSFQRIPFLEKFFDSKVVTVYTAASAVSAILVRGLEIYPQRDCLQAGDGFRILMNFFNAREPAKEQDNLCFKSDLYYEIKPFKANFATPTTLFANAFSRYLKDGCSTLVSFENTKSNLKELDNKVTAYCKTDIGFFSIAKQLEGMNQQALVQSYTYGAKL